MYGALSHNNTPVAAELNNIYIANIPDRNGQMLRNDLIDRMYQKGRPRKPIYTLEATIVASEADLGIQANATTLRTALDMKVNYSLVDANEKELFHATAHSVASFDKLDEQYATLASRADAYERTLTECSEQIVNRLSLYFSEGPLGAPDTPLGQTTTPLGLTTTSTPTGAAAKPTP